MGKIKVNPSTGKVLVFRDSSGNSKLCSTCCFGFAPNDCCCFLEPETEGACGNEDWDSFAPFGGPGNTPRFYSMTYEIVWQDSSETTTYHSTSIEFSGSFGNCEWVDNTTPDSDGNTGGVRIALRGFTEGVTQIIIAFNSVPDCSPARLFDVGDTTYRILSGPDLGECEITGTYQCEPGGLGSLCCMLRLMDGFEVESGDITISWHPGQISEWNSGSFSIGDLTGWKGVFYKCNQNHSNQEPPNAFYWDII